MAESVYKVIELIGTSKEIVRERPPPPRSIGPGNPSAIFALPIVELDLQLDAKGKVEAYRAKVKVPFKYED